MGTTRWGWSQWLFVRANQPASPLPLSHSARAQQPNAQMPALFESGDRASTCNFGCLRPLAVGQSACPPALASSSGILKSKHQPNYSLQLIRVSIGMSLS
eukprot:m.539600 g.539600  ORF g.539600 m.539600 type:complete len:100 (-) comp57635_c0_seq8:278-577(-)